MASIRILNQVIVINSFFFKVTVTFPNKQPAKNVPMLISAHGLKGPVRTQLRTLSNYFSARDMTDGHGEAEFVIDTCSNCDYITIQVEKYTSSSTRFIAS